MIAQHGLHSLVWSRNCCERVVVDVSACHQKSCLKPSFRTLQPKLLCATTQAMFFALVLSSSIEAPLARSLESIPAAPLSPKEFLARARDGHCGTTEDEGDCNIGQMGSFPGFPAHSFGKVPEPQQMKRAARFCLDACNACARCNFVSLSVVFKDCARRATISRNYTVLPAASRVSRSCTGSWYNSCDMNALQRPPRGSWSAIQTAGAFSRLPRTAAVAVNSTHHSWARPASRKRRAALRLPQAETGALEWVQARHVHC